MDKDVEKELEHVEGLLNDIKVNTSSTWWRTMYNGFLHGAGWVVGTVAGIFALGWVLSIFGVIPGFAEIAANLQTIMSSNF